MIARLGYLRSILNSKVQITGPHEVQAGRVILPIFEAVILKQTAKAMKEESTDPNVFRAGTVLQLTAVVEVTTKDRVAWISYPAKLYQHGIVSGPAFIPEYQSGPVEVVVQLFRDLDITDLEPISLFVEGG